MAWYPPAYDFEALATWRAVELNSRRAPDALRKTAAVFSSIVGLVFASVEPHRHRAVVVHHLGRPAMHRHPPERHERDCRRHAILVGGGMRPRMRNLAVPVGDAVVGPHLPHHPTLDQGLIHLIVQTPVAVSVGRHFQSAAAEPVRNRMLNLDRASVGFEPVGSKFLAAVRADGGLLLRGSQGKTRS